MGINDLMKWIRKAHPEAIKIYPKRWKDPAIRGKKVAIDATLITHRFHFAIPDEAERGRGSLVGWYNLMQTMRANQVQPIVIWDQRGVRDWKAPEARKRLATRALNLGRVRHEESRLERLRSLQEVIRKLRGIDEEERKLILGVIQGLYPRQPFPATETLPTTSTIFARLDESPDSSSVSDQTAITSQDTSSPSASVSPRNDNVTSNESVPSGPTFSPDILSNLSGPALECFFTLMDIYQQYWSSITPHDPIRTKEISDVLEHVRDLENLHQTIEPLPPSPIPPMDISTEVLDEKIEEVMSVGPAPETPRQAQLTKIEGGILASLLDTPTTFLPGEVEESTSSELVERGMDDGMRMKQLERLIETSPTIKRVFDKALDIPTTTIFERCKELLVKMGVPTLEAEIPFEGEGLAASLAKAGLVDFVGTEDSDVIAYEGPLLKGLTSTKEPLTLIDGSNLRTLTSLSSSSFLDFCILLGTDASPRIPNVGPINAYKLILQYSSIESILSNEPNIKNRIEDLEEEVFGKLPPIHQGIELRQGYLDKVGVEKFLVQNGIGVLDSGDEDERFEVVYDIEDAPSVGEWDESWDDISLTMNRSSKTS
ncbi:hypothetical protein TREMEDRAFT_68853 [Tremella mesenterica DSM 1558]|uniref:uncharacterized protein n=1 Tax=Tremella mesenterica (strain ATCC 24925 / CBS 8224 / DSM 1558 / NBRC 9311 / NRRL Y-6157 / RJB 2259-6 / UBC 559-6) TaxID=578456 RepID=UPI0003F490FA|nr:uncharacterized protein TREMEDRAFT_68853 [Tremella mesenterica DSM 1558]EIW68897.1 hypothetical protein TREMEDRAFT_68853 [Tremella mesenterica DSM 1558]